MPAKKTSKHQSKKSKSLQRQAFVPVAPPVAATATEAAPAPAPVAKAAPAPKAAPARQKVQTYPHFGGEMRRIAILAVIIIVVLVILSRVLT